MKKMIKRFLVGIVCIMMMVLCTGCSTTAPKNDNQASSGSASEELKKDIPEGNYTDTGKGSFILRGPSGTSENGNIPVFFVEEKYLAGQDYASPIDLGISTRDFDGSILTNCYVDGVLQEKVQLANTDTSLYVSEKLSKVGKHKVELLQFDDNNNVITYKSAEYEIKTK